MSIQDLFEKNISSAASANSGSSKVESYDFVLAKNDKNNKFEPRIDFSSASNFSFYGSAELYYEKAIERIYNNYPYDGSRLEKLQFEMSSSQFEEWMLKNLYPKSTGYINMSYGGWGTQSSITDGYGLPVDVEYIYSRGGMHTASGGMAGKELFKTFDKSVKYDKNINRTTNFRMNVPDGFTVEFWLKKEAFDITKTEKEVVLDLWNGQVSSSSDYGRFTLELTSSGESDGSDTFLVTLQSGTVGFFQQPIGNSSVTTGSLEDWHHYAFSFSSNSSGVDSRIYVDGNLNEKVSLGTQGVNEIDGLINGYIGALQTSPSSSQGTATGVEYSGKLSASLDEFRFWKTRRTSEQISIYWNQSVGAGANTDISNIDLGIYYKFNEGIVGIDSYDSVVLDYSGRIANGSWTGYSEGSRNTGSAIVSSSAAISEEADPIIYSIHPDVVSLKQDLQASGSARDNDNGNILINRFPSWLVDEDESINSNFKYLTQIISSFLDELYLEITELRKLKFADYYSAEYKPLPFADRLILERGIEAKDILRIATTLEKYEKRNADTKVFESDINDIKNIIYQNIYNNLPKILKSKGTERSFRNMLRCFGFDDELVKLNIYTNQGTHYFTDKYKVTSRNKKVIDFGNSNAFSSIVFQTSSAGNTRSYIYGSDTLKKEEYNAFTFEINTLMPYKSPSNEDSYVYYGELTSSIGGFHQAALDTADLSFDGDNVASLQIFAIRNENDSKHAKFMLKSHDGSLELTSSLFFDVYDNNLWTLAARVKPVGYPFYGSYSSEDQEYIVDFYGVRHKAGDVDDYFHISSSVSYTSGSSFLSNRKRVFVGANREDFTGTTLQKSDVKISNCRFYLDYLENSVLNEHNKDVTIHGSNKSYEGNTAFGTDLEDKRISSLETIALNWDFNKVTGSNSSGEFIVQDISSGSTDTIYGWADEIIRREHRGLGYDFQSDDSNLVSNEFLTLYKKELPEVSYTADDITIAGILEETFLTDEDISDSMYALEKSMYQVISEKMLESLSSTSEMSNLFGKVIDRYRMNYKNLDYARRMFFDKVEEDPDFDKFTEYFRWIDNSIFNYIKDLIPASANFVENISDIVESHIFERNKVRTLLPNKFVSPVPDDHISGIRELRYNWKFGHAPLPTSNVAASYSSIEFTADHSSGDHEDSLQVTASGENHLIVYADPNQALTIEPSTIDHLIYTGSTGLAFKALGTSQTFAGKNPYSGLSAANLSISFFLSGSDVSNTQRISIRDSSQVPIYEVNGDQDISVYVASSGGNSTATFNTNNDGWTHYAIVLSDTNTPVLYKNGSPISATGYSDPGGTMSAIDKLYIYLDDEQAFQDIVLWNKQLTAADVSKLYNDGIWLNPTSVSSSQINDWYKFGYEDNWTGSLGDVLSQTETIYSAAGTGNNDLVIGASNAVNFQFTTGINPFGSSKSQTTIYDEIVTSLDSKFSSVYGATTYDDSGPDIFTIQSASLGENTTISSTATGTGFFSNVTVDNGTDYSLVYPTNTNCLWEKEREERTDIPQRETIRQIIVNDNGQEANNLVDSSGNTYEGSTYALRRLSRPYKESVSMAQTLHGGTNYQIQKNRRISKNAVEPHSKLSNSGVPLNVMLIGAGPGQGIELKTECVDVIDPNKKIKYDIHTFLGKFSEGNPGGSFTPVDDTAEFSYGLKGAYSIPFNIFSGGVGSGYNKRFEDGWKEGAVITNVHSDTANDQNDIPLQSPFTQQWVGGHQSRHQDINRYDTTLIDGENLVAPPNNLHNIYTRPEGYRLLLVENGGGSDGAIGLADAQYGVTAIPGHPNIGKYPDVAKKKATYFREETSKRPVNIKNIRTTTGSYSHGNYREQYEVLSVASGKENNNPLFRSIVDTHQYLPSAIEDILPQTTNYHTLIGVSNHPSGNVFGVGESNILNNEVETFEPGVIGDLSFDIVAVSSIAHNSVLELTGGSITYSAETRDPNDTTTASTVPDKIMYTGSFGLAFKSAGAALALASDNTHTGIGTNSVSISFWLSGSDGDNNTNIYFYDSAFVEHTIRLDDDIFVQFQNTSYTSANTTFNTNNASDSGWNHFVIHMDVNNLSTGVPRLWKNGVELENTGYTPVGGTTPNIGLFYIQLNDGMAFQDIVLWDKLLTQEDIDLIYANNQWVNPITHPSSSNIIDWYKFGYEDYWSGLGYTLGSTLDDHDSPPYIISSSYGNSNHLSVGTDYDEDFEFTTGNNPFGTSKSNSDFWDELETSLSDSFTDLTVSYTGTGPASFELVASSKYDITMNATETGADFSNPISTDGVAIYQEFGFINTTSKTTGSVQKSVISTRFSAPGGIETMTYGFLDAYNQEKSVYNALSYRNLLLRKSGSGEDGTIRLDDHLGKRHGLITHLSRHSGKFGADSVYGSVTSGDYVTIPSYHKIPRNTARKPASDSSLETPTFNMDHDNFFVRSTLPRSDFQYTWITSSLGDNYSITSGKQRMFGYAPRDGILSSSYEVDGDSGFVPAITFPTASELFGE